MLHIICTKVPSSNGIGGIKIGIKEKKLRLYLFPLKKIIKTYSYVSEPIVIYLYESLAENFG